MRNILITGGAGFIASNLAKRLIEDPKNYVVLVDNLITGKIENLPSSKYNNWKFIKADSNNYEELMPIMVSTRFNLVFHYAALVGVKRTLEYPIKVLDDITGIRTILDLSKNTGVDRIFFSSSSEVYGEPVELPQHETRTPLNSKLPYAIVKNIGEAFCRSYFQEFGLNYTIFRFFNTYGPGQSNDFVVSKFIMSALKNENITVYGDGNQTRTFCFISDNIDTTIRTLENHLFINDTINIGNDSITTILKLAQTIIKLTNSKSKIIHLDPLKEGDMTRRQPEITRMKQALNKEMIPLEAGLMDTIQYFRD